MKTCSDFSWTVPATQITALTIMRPLWCGDLTKPLFIYDRRQDVQEDILTWLILPGQEQGSETKFILAYFLSQRTFTLTPLTQASHKESFHSICYSRFSGQVPYVWITFMKHKWSLTPWKLRDHKHFRSTGVSRLISGSQNNYIVVVSCTRTLSMSRFMLWYDTAGILHLHF